MFYKWHKWTKRVLKNFKLIWYQIDNVIQIDVTSRIGAVSFAMFADGFK